MLLRILSAMVLGPLFIVAILWLKPLFYVLMILVAIGMLCEWYDMTSSSLLHLLTGLVVIPLPIGSLILLHARDNNQWLILLYFVIIWSVDTFAMIGGKIVGGLRLAPKISPKKTWSGLIVGVISAGFITVFVNYYFLHSYFSRAYYLFIISCSLALTAQLSDLFVSYFKRKFNIKDSGTIIPGHGGVLDRFDSIILTAPILLFLYLYDYF
ncbi:phosphatidate cytidylyltransferase [Rickettsia endosymbiont of Polydrusus tereticollis]|uniref:phosphatidate cytidylyltransferase n=1 Tax=Rickettsia endosymbiont of Polydrusus tereticollis TaxID=3066251 RepID=UPI003132BA66